MATTGDKENCCGDDIVEGEGNQTWSRLVKDRMFWNKQAEALIQLWITEG